MLWKKEKSNFKNTFDVFKSVLLLNMSLTLNVGGMLFQTSKSTISPCRYFTCLMQNCNEDELYMFIDRDGTHFRYILNWLRGSQVLPLERHALDELYVEADFYGMTEMMRSIQFQKQDAFSWSLELRQLAVAIRQSASH